MKTLARIAFEWGIRSFGTEHMMNLPLRSLRLVEEAVELAQALDVPKDKMIQLIEVVYSRPKGNVVQELGGISVTLSVFCTAIGTSVKSVFTTEMSRILAKTPEDFAKRNKEKLDLGLN